MSKPSKNLERQPNEPLNPAEQMQADLAKDLIASGLTEVAPTPRTDTETLTASFLPQGATAAYERRIASRKQSRDDK